MFYNKDIERKHKIPLKPLYPDHLLWGSHDPYTVLDTRSRKCLLFQVCIIQDESVKAHSIYTLHLLTSKWSWPNLVSLSLGFSCQLCWICWRYDMHFYSINLMPAVVSPLNDVCKIRQVEALALLLTSILTFFVYKQIWSSMWNGCCSSFHNYEPILLQIYPLFHRHGFNKLSG